MWPWEHAVVGYVVVSLCCRLCYRTPPGDWTALAVVAASMLPDLVDKPLAWQFGLFETGHAVAHSVFVAVPACAAVWLYARRTGRGAVGAGTAVGYLLHLPADVGYYFLSTGRWLPERLLWPVRTAEPSSVPTSGFLEGVLLYLLPYLGQIAAGEPSRYLLAQLALGVLAVVLWLLDGTPGVTPFANGVASARRSLTS